MLESVDKEEQRKAKRLILRRLYPGLREAHDDEVNAVIKKMSAVYPGLAVNQNPFTMGADAMDGLRPPSGTYVGSGVFPTGQGIGQSEAFIGTPYSGSVVRGF